jgi:ABC-type Fe3+ transport system permease subunit
MPRSIQLWAISALPRRALQRASSTRRDHRFSSAISRFCLAVLVAEVLVVLIPLLAVVYPLFRFAPTIYDWLERRRIYKRCSGQSCPEVLREKQEPAMLPRRSDSQHST